MGPERPKLYFRPRGWSPWPVRLVRRCAVVLATLDSYGVRDRPADPLDQPRRPPWSGSAEIVCVDPLIEHTLQSGRSLLVCHEILAIRAGPPSPIFRGRNRLLSRFGSLARYPDDALTTN